MAGSVTTALTNSSLAEYLSGGHVYLPPQAGLAVTQSSTISGVLTTALAGLAVGMAQTGTNAGAGAVIATFTPGTVTNYTTSVASSGALTSATFTADLFKIALIASALSGNIAYGATVTNVGTPGTSTPSLSNLGTDEQAATGSYAAGGLALTPSALAQTNPVNSAAVGFSTTIQWTSATISTAGAIIYNTSTRLSAATAPANNRATAVFSFGGAQSVTAGTLTLTQPTQDGHTGLIRLSPN